VLAVSLWHPLALSRVVCFVIYINRFQSALEERILACLFGDVYRAYYDHGRRWLYRENWGEFMLRRYWQSSMIRLARANRLRRFVQKNRAASFLASKYVAGSTPAQALQRVERLKKESGIRSSLFYLGEYVNLPELVALNVENKLAITRLLEKSAIDVHISVDPTQIGYTTDPTRVLNRALKIGSEIKRVAGEREGVHCLMLDMEDHSLVSATIDLQHQLARRNIPVAITLQAYLRRTYDDMQMQIKSASRVRLVKGAFLGTQQIAYIKHEEIKQNYYDLVALMLSAEAREHGFYPIIATHDELIHDYAIETARRNGWQQGEYEFEMLLGVRSDVAKALAERGERVRLYVPFGKDWFPYAVRRIGESPRNFALLMRSLIS
jgi:proline dehydrogenase